MPSIISEQYDAILAAPFARLGVRGDAQAVHRIDFLPADGEMLAPRAAHLAIVTLADALAHYWEDPQATLDEVPLRYAGTAHQRKVWQAMLGIPPGTTLTYGGMAKQIGSSPRAVGQACGANPLPLVIPCHRVVAHAGTGGFMRCRAGEALDYKHWLLAHEARGADGA